MTELSGNQKRKMRSAARLYAVQALFQMEAAGQDATRVIEEFEYPPVSARAVMDRGFEFADGDL